MEWLPYEDKIAGMSENLVLRYSPDWSGAGETMHAIEVPACYGEKFEPWHIRYVGKPHAAIIYNDRLTLEKYIDSFETGEWYSADGYLISRQTVGESVTMPKAFGSAVISPDNTGCYIITVKQ